MPIFPDPGTGSPHQLQPKVGQIAWDMYAEEYIDRSGQATWYFWGALILLSHYNYTMQGPADIYPVAQTMKNFYVFPVTPGASMSIASVSVDIPPEDVNTLRYSVTIVNTGQVLGGYRLLATSNEIILDGSYLLPSA